jgi:hypothetical protein
MCVSVTDEVNPPGVVTVSVPVKKSPEGQSGSEVGGLEPGMVSPTPKVAVVVAPTLIGLGAHERFGLIGSARTARSAGVASRSRAARVRRRALALGMFRCMYFIKDGHPKSAYKPCEPEIHAYEPEIHVTFCCTTPQKHMEDFPIFQAGARTDRRTGLCHMLFQDFRLMYVKQEFMH